MKKQEIFCPSCDNKLSFRRWSKREGEVLADCNNCGKYQIRYEKIGDKIIFGEPYRTKTKSQNSKTKMVSGRMIPEEYISILEKFGSFQKMLDCFSAGVLHQQYNP